MNYKIIISILFTCGILFVACTDDFLDVYPKGTLNDEILNTEDGIEGLCISAYSALAGPEGDDGAYLSPTTNWIYGDVRAETAYKGGGGITDLWEYHAFETFQGVYATNGLLDRKWYHLYISVQRANNAIRMLNTVTEEEFPLKNTRMGEMRFLRAHFFFELSRLFNKIPYFDENVADEDYVKIPNNEFTRDEILGKIAAEFEAAAELLPTSQAEKGRITKYAAYAYQAKATLYRAYKQNPETNKVLGAPDSKLLEKVVELCNLVAGGGYDLLKDFQQLAEIEYEDGVESVFAIQHSIDDGTNLGRINWSNLLNAPPGPAYGGDGFFQPSQNLVNSYKTNDEGTPRFGDYNTGDIVRANDGFKYKIDPRLDFTVGRIGIRWKTFEKEPYSAGWSREPAAYGYTACKKFLLSPESGYMVEGWPWGGSALNFQIIRYADVLLWKAEALIELGREKEALPIINRIRERAKNSQYVLKWNNTTDTDYAANYLIEPYKEIGATYTWDQEFARKALRFERKLELAMEGERFFDLVRWGIADKVLNEEYFPKEKTLRSYYDKSQFKSGRDEYFPVPQAQINFSGGLYQQNPGYELTVAE